MNVLLVGLNHRTAPVAIRERLAISEERLGEALYRLTADPAIEEGFILSTCNRVEVYAVARETTAGFAALERFLLATAPDLPADRVLPCLYLYKGCESLRHLLRVASGLDSLVIGEPQILGQVKEAFEAALRHKTTGVLLNKVVRQALSVAKRVRTETQIATHAVSISSAAVTLSKKIFGKLQGRAALLIGAGEMAELAARHLISQRIASLTITNRSYERAVDLAQALGGTPAPFEELIARMVESDIVICSAGAPHYLVGVAEVARVVAARENRPIFFIDISVPRNIDPAINTLDNVFLYDIDDLKIAVEGHVRLREAEALKAEVIVGEEAERLSRWLKSLDAVPMIVALRDRAEEIRSAEVEKALGKIGGLTPEQKAALDGVTIAIVNKLLHYPLTALKAEAASANGNMLLEAARLLFQLQSFPISEGQEQLEMEKDSDIPPVSHPYLHAVTNPISSGKPG